MKKLWKFKPCRCFQEEIPNIYEGFLTLAFAAWLGVPPSGSPLKTFQRLKGEVSGENSGPEWILDVRMFTICQDEVVDSFCIFLHVGMVYFVFSKNPIYIGIDDN